MALLVKKFTQTAQLPVRGSSGAAGFDLASDEDKMISPREWTLVNTGIGFTVPDGTYGRIAPRSGFSYRQGTMIGAGVIDSDYTGEVKVLVFNLSENTIHISRGMRIAQLIIEKIKIPAIIEVDDLNDTNRGTGGFGSTG